LSEFLPEFETPAPPPARVMSAAPAADLAQLDALLVAMRGRLISLDADLDQLQELSHQVGDEYRRLAAQAHGPKPSRPAPQTRAPRMHQELAFASTVAGSAVSVPSEPAVAFPRTRRTTTHHITIVRIPDLTEPLRWARVAAIPTAAAIAGFLLAPSLGLFQGSAPQRPPAVASLATPAPTPIPFAATPTLPPPAPGPPPAPAVGRADPAPPAPAPVATLLNAPRVLGFVGTLQIRSNPVGAAVYLNQQYVGETPLKLPRLRAGSHVIWVEQVGYERWTAGVLVPTDKITQVQVTLQREHGGQQ
jgi:hypothetical protein